MIKKTVGSKSGSEGGIDMSKTENMSILGRSGYERISEPGPLVEPTMKEILAIERALSGESKDLFEEAMTFLERAPQDDYADRFKRENLKYLIRGFDRVLRDNSRPPGSELAEVFPLDVRPQGVLKAKIRVNGKIVEEHDLGLISVNVVTNAGVNYVIDSLQGSATINNLRHHGSGTSNTAENASDTALGTEVESRVSGTQEEGASANIFKTVATVAYTATRTIVEHGLFSASSGGTLFDRSVFTGIGVDSSTSIEFTYEWTLNAGG